MKKAINALFVLIISSFFVIHAAEQKSDSDTAKSLAMTGDNDLFLKNKKIDAHIKYKTYSDNAEREQRFSSPIQYKLYFDRAVAKDDITRIMNLLSAKRKDLVELRRNYPFAMKLYRILIEYSGGEDFTNEARYIPIQVIAEVAKTLAKRGDNDLFLKNMSQYGIADSEIKLDSDSEYESYFDEAVREEHIEQIVILLKTQRKDLVEFRKDYPLAMKLYRILIENSPQEDFSDEENYIPIEAITAVAKALAIKGHNNLFLKNMPQ
jgi:hypothetical protein